MPNYYAVLGQGGKGEAEALSLLGNFQTKIFHANGDIRTNHYAAEMIGKAWQTKLGSNAGASLNPFQPGATQTEGTSASEVMEYQLQPREFTALRKGGAEHGGQVDAILFQGGRVWNASGRNYLRATFRQG